MSEIPGKQAKTEAHTQLSQDSVSSKRSVIRRNKQDRICVIITQKKNCSWIEDLDARERLNKCQRVYH